MSLSLTAEQPSLFGLERELLHKVISKSFIIRKEEWTSNCFEIRG